jgi:hypothetical protein
LVSRAQEITKPVLVIADDVIVGAVGAERSVVTDIILDGASPLLLLAIICTGRVEFGAMPVKVAELVVEEEGVVMIPSSK